MELRPNMPETVDNGTIRNFDGTERVFYDGYWIRYYPPPDDSPRSKKVLLESLARRTFHQTEAGINTPGERLDMAREAYESETDPARKRANGAMLAGALFNRANDILSIIADLAEDGVLVDQDNELMIDCGNCLKEALKYGKTVKHYSGEEGIDELWGEPLKAFSVSMKEYYESRYVKIAQTMRNVDNICERMSEVFGQDPAFTAVAPLITSLADAAKAEMELFRTDPLIFRVWPDLVAAGEAIEQFQPHVNDNAEQAQRLRVRTGMRLLINGKNILFYLAGARVPMPKTTREYLRKCNTFVRGEIDLDLV